MLKFSLLLATVGRTAELERFLSSLDAQTYRNFDLIVVDQNPDERLAALVQSYAGRFPVLCVKSAPGLSRARNAGLRYVSGDVIAFPDDDCWYPPDLLRKATLWLESNVEYDGLSVLVCDGSGRPSGHWAARHGAINRYDVWQKARSMSVLLRRRVVDAVGAFDESLGAGAGSPWGSGEETDYLIRAMQVGYHFYYEPALSVCHPEFREVAKAYAYGMGYGRVLRKHAYPAWFVICCWARSLGGALLSLAALRFYSASCHWAALKGRMRGWIQ